jgi:hypothetical protein
MTYLERLREAVAAEVGAGRIGEPVFARLVVEASADHGHLLGTAAAAAAFCGEILRAEIERLLVLGSVESGHLSVQVELAGGKSALVAAALLRRPAPRVDLLLVGNHGALSHSPPAETLELELAEAAAALFAETGRLRPAREAVAASLSAGQPVRPGKGE